MANLTLIQGGKSTLADDIFDIEGQLDDLAALRQDELTRARVSGYRSGFNTGLAGGIFAGIILSTILLGIFT